MTHNAKFKPKAGYVYVVTNECLKLVEAKGAFKGRMVKAVKIGNAKDFTNRLGSLNTAVYEIFDLHLSIRTDNVIALEGAIQDVLQDYRIFTQEKNRTEFFACPIEEVIRRVKQHSKRGFIANIEKMVEYKGGKRLGRSGVNIRSNIKKHETAKAKVEKPTRDGKERARAFSFAEVEIPAGAKLVFIPTGVEVSVVDDKKIEYKNTEYSLSGFCKVLMPHKIPSGAYQGPKFFSYNGKTLLDIRKEREANCL